MEFRFLGNSGLKVSAISYGNWLTHGAQVEADQVTACVRAALEAAITTFDTADTYANGRAETILGDALAAERRESLEILTSLRRHRTRWPERQRPVPQAHPRIDQRIGHQVAD